MQRLRSDNKISHSVLSGKAYYSMADIRKTLNDNKILTIDEQISTLKEAHSERLKSVKNKKISLK